MKRLQHVSRGSEALSWWPMPGLAAAWPHTEPCALAVLPLLVHEPAREDVRAPEGACRKEGTSMWDPLKQLGSTRRRGTTSPEHVSTGLGCRGGTVRQPCGGCSLGGSPCRSGAVAREAPSHALGAAQWGAGDALRAGAAMKLGVPRGHRQQNERCGSVPRIELFQHFSTPF